MDAASSEAITLHVRPVRFVDGAYDVNGTYFGSGDPLYWIADDRGAVDFVVRAKDRDAAISQARTSYPRALISDDVRAAGEELDEFVIAYATAALWADLHDEDGEPIDGMSIDDIAPDTLAKMSADCAAFREQTHALLEASGLDEGQQGHDFWLTRNGHGAGFWDRGLGEIGKALKEACRRFGETSLYLGDDGKVYAE